MEKRESVREYVTRTKTVPVTIEPPVKSLECIRSVVMDLRSMGCKARHQGGLAYTIEALVPFSAMGDVMESMDDNWGYTGVQA